MGGDATTHTSDGPPGGKCWVRVEDGGRGAFVTLLVGESHAPGTAIVAVHSPGRARGRQATCTPR